ncbi:MAG: T9SS type A sorting domain-containing protein [Ignavibacteria bacterium]|nr:T9SS type A sorting domain-containing protein [Ignavibacteria bacterium]
MKKNFLGICLFAFLTVPVFAQDTSIVNFLPLNIGNVWVYSCNQQGNPPACGICTKRIKLVITSTIIINGHLYYQGSFTTIHLSGSCPFCGSNLPSFINIRVDSASGNVLEYSANNGCSYRPNEILYDSLRARLLDSIRYNCQPPVQFSAYVCRDTSSLIFFGQSRQARSYSIQGFESSSGRGYVKGIGIAGGGYGSVGCQNSSQLLGCVINGVVYGDTGFIVGINQISSEVPEQFSLSQNYPNPFNPTTHIGFRIAEFGLVRIIVFDAIGREVQTLVNQDLSMGTYEVDFNGTNLPSGVYYYMLESESFAETKKMVLLK